MISCPEIGQLVVVRRRPFVVIEIVPSVTNPSRPNHLLKLSSVEDDGLGEEMEVIWELEPGTSIHEKSTLPVPSAFDDPKQLQAFLDAVRWGAISQADDRELHSPFRSGIEIDEYQLDPVVRALSMPRVNLLIADDVGLGKTIEAGLVVQDPDFRKIYFCLCDQKKPSEPRCILRTEKWRMGRTASGLPAGVVIFKTFDENLFQRVQPEEISRATLRPGQSRPSST